MITALHIRTDGTRELFTYDPNDGSSLDTLQAKVGGWIQLAPALDRTITMYCNEEGKIKGLPVNRDATEMLGPGNPDVIVGDVVIVGAADREGYDTDLPAIYKESANG